MDVLYAQYPHSKLQVALQHACDASVNQIDGANRPSSFKFEHPEATVLDPDAGHNENGEDVLLRLHEKLEMRSNMQIYADDM